MTELKEGLEIIQREAASRTPTTRFVRALGDKPDDHVRQGDIRIDPIRLSLEHLKPLTTRQLAPGTSRGAHHMAVGDEVTIYERLGNALAGPIINSPTRWLLTHPVHDDYDMPPGRFEVTYQRDVEQEEIAAVRD